MILGLLEMAAANAAVLLGAHAILVRVRTGAGPVDLVLFLVLRLLLISSAVVAGGLTSKLDRSSLGLAGAAAIILLLVAGAHRRLPRLSVPRLPAWIWVLSAIVGLRLLLQVWLFSPHLGDALAYHLPKLGEWVRTGAFTREMGLHPHVSFPAGFELIELWWVVFLRHDVIIELAGVEFLILAGAAVHALARRIGLDPRGALLGASLYVLMPGFYLSTLSGLNDSPAAAMVIATAALIAGRVPVPLLVATAGLGIGIKATYGFALPGMALLWWFMRREPSPPTPGSRGATVAVMGIGLVLGLFWYLRNLLWYGDAFYPLGTSGIDNPVAVQFGPRPKSLVLNLGDLVVARIYDNQCVAGANVDHISGWGGAAFSCGLLSLAIVLRTDIPLRRLAAAFGLSLLSALMFSQNDPWCLKYVFFFPALLFLAASRLAMDLAAVGKIAGAGLALSFLMTMLPYDLPPRDLMILARQGWRERSAAKMQGLLANEDAVGCFGGHGALAYLLYGPDFERRVTYLRPSSADNLVEEMTRSRVRLLYALPSSRADKEILETCLRRDRLRRLEGHFYALP